MKFNPMQKTYLCEHVVWDSGIELLGRLGG